MCRQEGHWRGGDDLNEMELMLMLDVSRRCSHKDIVLPAGSFPRTDILMVKVCPSDANGAAAARSSSPFPR